MASDVGERAREVRSDARQTPGFGRNQDVPDAGERDAGNDDVADEADNAKPSIFKNRLVQIGASVVVALMLIGSLIWWLNARQYENTDDAFIDTHIVNVAPQIAGQVIKVPVNDNQLVQKGELLVEINSADATARLTQVQAQGLQARTQYEQALAAETGAAALAQNAERDLARYRLLQRLMPAAVAQQQIDQAVAADKNAVAQRDAARAQVSGAQAQIGMFKAQIGAAQLNLGYTKIFAPVDGHIAQRSVATGDYVSPGQEMLAIVPLKLWVTANFKETQLARIRVGQKVTVEVDACGDADVEGHVDSIQRGAGQAFGILPPENATGNYVKVVQRVPVKIVLDRIPHDCTLGPGMSVEPNVKVR
jgi:membrane fusion protein (multidrug efflux system)